jgi:BirA family biotin operon repressor/biotin-[acetyl-CoA-carboxylase] ligase
VGAADVVIRWPNDLLWRGRKLGGILAEMRGTPDRGGDLVIGIGINVAEDPDRPSDLRPPPVSLAEAAGGAAPEREVLAALLLRELAGLSRALEHGDWRTVARRWEELAPAAHGRRVRIVERATGAAWEGTTCGLAGDGALRVRRADGRVEPVRSVESVEPQEERSCC